MTPQDSQNKIEELSNQVKTLTDRFNFLDSKTEIYRNEKPLNVYLDEESKKIIEQTVRRFYRKTSNTVGAGFVLEPATQFHQLTGTAARTSDTTTAVKDGGFVGQILVIEGTHDTNTITITDNANTKMAGNVILGVNDTLTLMWNGDDWVELCRNNA